MKKNLVVANVREETIAFACAVMTRYLRTFDRNPATPDFFLTLPGTFQTELFNQCSHNGGYGTIIFLGELFPKATEKKALGDALEAAVGKNGASTVIYISGSVDSPKKYMSGSTRKEARYSDTALGLLPAVLEHCNEDNANFYTDDILSKQKDDYTQYCLRNALDEYRLHHDSQYFVTLVQKLAEQPNIKPIHQPLKFEKRYSSHQTVMGSSVEWVMESSGYHKLSGEEWSSLLRRNPEEAVHCQDSDWAKLTGTNWADLLKEQPGFAEQCNKYEGWKLLSGDNWAELLYRHYQSFQKYCSWDKLSHVDGRLITRLLERHKEVLDNCSYDLNSLEPSHWADLLENQPDFASQCKCWDAFNGEDWMTLLSDQPQFASQCDAANGWSKMNKLAWLDLLPMQPSFAPKCPDTIWKLFEASDWMRLLKCRKPFNTECTKFDGWDKLDGDNWASLLSTVPNYSDKCSSHSQWGKLNGKNWRSLLQVQPRFENQCSQAKGWLLLAEDDWVELLKVQPDFQKHQEIKLGPNIKPEDWISLLAGNPALAKQCNCLDSFSSEQWSALLQRQPELFIFCPEGIIRTLGKESWIPLLGRFPELSEKCTIWDALQPEDWCALISQQTKYALQCNAFHGWNSFTTENWIKLLSSQPQFAVYFDRYSSWDSLTTEQWISLLKEQPQFQNKEAFARHRRNFTVSQWCNLLSKQPQMDSPEVPWDSFSTENWLGILKSSSYFNKKIMVINKDNHILDKFSPTHWQDLLCARPEFIHICPCINEISIDIWKRVITAKGNDDGLEMIPRNVLHALDKYDLNNFLRFHPRLAHLLTEQQLQKVDDFIWVKSFVANGGKLPGGIAYDWRGLQASSWSYLLSHYPEYQEQCTRVNGWKNFEGNSWSRLLSNRPEFKRICQERNGWATLDGNNWEDLLVSQPQFADICDWSTLTSKQLMHLLQLHPSLKSKIKPNLHVDLSDELILAEIHGKPFIAPDWVTSGNIPWHKLTSTDLSRVLVMNPLLENDYKKQGIFDILNGIDWYIILRRHPKFIQHCPLKYLAPKMRLAILSQNGVVSNLLPNIPWPQAEELNLQETLDSIIENGTFRDGMLPRRLINWHNLSKVKPEYAPCCSPDQWNELDIRGWWALEDSFLEEIADASQEEKLWRCYSCFLRLPQMQLDQFEKDSPDTFENLYKNAMTKYRSMLVGDGLRPLRNQLRMAANNHYPVLILGESGTGKENAARMLHTGSGRSGQFEAFNCASSTSSLIESTLFGHVKGAFTGAVRKVDGIILKANEGTLFFDEIAEFPLETQAKLLRVMQWHTSSQKDSTGHIKDLKKMVYAYRPVGGEDEPDIEVDVRIVAATNRNLEKMIDEKDPNEQRFRQDLYYRLNSIVIETLPLREHKEDIEEIANLFWRIDLQMPTPLQDEDVAYLKTLDYPANVRQLQQLLVQYSIYFGHKTLPEIYRNLSAISRNAQPQPEPSPSTAAPSPSDDDQSDTEPLPAQSISIIDEQTGSYKTAEAIDREYAKLIHQKLGQGLAATATVLKVAINTLRNRLK